MAIIGGNFAFGRFVTVQLAAAAVSLQELFFAERLMAAPLGGLSETKSLVGSLVNVGAALVVVLLLLYAFVYLLKKSGISQGGASNSKIKVLETKMVAPKKYIAIVEVAGKVLSVGITEHNINLLTELDDNGLNALSSAAESQDIPTVMTGFRAVFQKVIGDKNPGGGRDDA